VGAITASGGTVDPGASIGILNGSSANFNGGGNLVIQIQGYAAAGTDYDRLNLTGALTMGGTSTITFDLQNLSTTGTAAGIVMSTSQVNTFTNVVRINNPNNFQACLTYNGTTTVSVTIQTAACGGSTALPPNGPDGPPEDPNPDVNETGDSGYSTATTLDESSLPATETTIDGSEDAGVYADYAATPIGLEIDSEGTIPLEVAVSQVPEIAAEIAETSDYLFETTVCCGDTGQIPNMEGFYQTEEVFQVPSKLKNPKRDADSIPNFYPMMIDLDAVYLYTAEMLSVEVPEQSGPLIPSNLAAAIAAWQLDHAELIDALPGSPGQMAEVLTEQLDGRQLVSPAPQSADRYYSSLGEREDNATGDRNDDSTASGTSLLRERPVRRSVTLGDPLADL
jgi:hypothetical protein